MSFLQVSALFRGIWLIRPEYVDAQLPLLAKMLDGKLTGGEFLQGKGEFEKPFAYNAGERFPLSIYEYQTDTYKPNPAIPPNSVGVLPIIGPTTKYDGDCGAPGSITRMAWASNFQQNPNICGIMSYIDCPGGQADGTPQMGDHIQSLDKPTLGFIAGGAYSAGYWQAAAHDDVIMSHQMDGAGSIGAYRTFVDYKPMLEKKGIKIHEIYPPESADKNLGYREALKGNYDLATSAVSGLAKAFRGAVSTTRGNRLKSDDWKTGKEFNGQDAVDIGLVDGIGSFNDAAEHLQDRAKSQKRTTVSFSNPNSPNKMFGNKFTALTALAGVAASAITADKIDAVNAQITENKIEGVTLVADMELEKLVSDNAGAQKIKTDLGTAQGQVTKLTAELSAANTAKTAAETAQTAAEQKATALQTQLDAANAKIKELGGQPAAAATTGTVEGTEVVAGEQPKVNAFYSEADAELAQLRAQAGLLPKVKKK